MGSQTALIAAFVLIAASVLLQSYTGRRALVAAVRANCERSAQNIAVTVNHIRLDQETDRIVAFSSGVPQAVQRARLAEVDAEEVEIRKLDSHIDRGVWGALRDPRDRAAVRSSGFRCSKAFPAASPFKFF